MSSETAVETESAELPPNLRVPASILVGTIRFRVTSDPDDWLRIEHRTKTGGYYGHTTPLDAMIYLNPDQAPDVMRLTLWHEVIHAALEAVAGKPQWTDLGDDQGEREEAVVRRIESPTLAVLRDNPALVTYLTATS